MMRTGLVTVISLALLLVGCVVYPRIGVRLTALQTVLQAFPHLDPQNFGHNAIVRLHLSCSAVALLTGASLGVAGTSLQAVIRNPLGKSHTLGLNTGAALAVVAAGALGLVFPVECPLLASTGGTLLLLLTLLPSSAGRSGVMPMKVTLCGVALLAFVPPITAIVLTLDGQALLATQTRLAGNLVGQDWATLGTSVWFSLGGFMLALCPAPSLNILALGDRMAQGLGVFVLRTRTFTLFTTVLLCGAAVSVASPIGFIGLLVPQIIRRLISADLRVLLPLSTCVGVLLLLLADIIARTLFVPHELAIGVMTALVGAPAFVTMATRISKQVG